MKPLSVILNELYRREKFYLMIDNDNSVVYKFYSKLDRDKSYNHVYSIG